MGNSIWSRQQEEDGVINKHTLYEALLYLAFVKRNLGILLWLRILQLRH